MRPRKRNCKISDRNIIAVHTLQTRILRAPLRLVKNGRPMRRIFPPAVTPVCADSQTSSFPSWCIACWIVIVLIFPRRLSLLHSSFHIMPHAEAEDKLGQSIPADTPHVRLIPYYKPRTTSAHSSYRLSASRFRHGNQTSDMRRARTGLCRA